MTQTFVRHLALTAAFALAAGPALAQSSDEFRFPRGAERADGRVFGGYEHDRDDDSDSDRDSDSEGGRGRGQKKAKKAPKKCWDVNRDGYCDDVQRRSPRCDDRNRDGRCDDVYGRTVRHPATLPEMVGAILVSRGRTSGEVTRWLGERALTVRTDATRGRVRRAAWYDRSGQLLQTWTDRDLDGRADVVQVYRAGQLVRTIGRS